MPNWLGDVVMALPLLRAIRASRPYARITLLAKAQFHPLLEQLGIADEVRSLPPPGPGYWPHFHRLRHEYPDCCLLLTNSLRGDLEAWLTRCPQRFGLVRPGRPRPLLTHAWRVPASFDEQHPHQSRLWEEFLRHFGLNVAPDLAPFTSDLSGIRYPKSEILIIGLICGSENDPEKRWPVAHWRTLITRIMAAHPQVRFQLFGTANDRAVTDAVALDLNASVENLAGRTDLTAFAARLAGCRLLISNDTGGLHLANAFGVPVLALFGPTNPLRTAPVFHAPVRVLQPAGCPPAGGGDLAQLTPDTVFTAATEMFA